MNFPQDSNNDTFHLIPPISEKNRETVSSHTSFATNNNKLSDISGNVKNRASFKGFLSRLPLLFAALIFGFGIVTIAFASFKFSEQVSNAIVNCVNSPKECVTLVSNTSLFENNQSIVSEKIADAISSVYDFAVDNSLALANSVSVNFSEIYTYPKLNSNISYDYLLNHESKVSYSDESVNFALNSSRDKNAFEQNNSKNYFSNLVLENLQVFSSASNIFASSFTSGAKVLLKNIALGANNLSNYISKNVAGFVNNTTSHFSSALNSFSDFGNLAYKKIQIGYQGLGNISEINFNNDLAIGNAALAFSSLSTLKNSITCTIERFIGSGKASCDVNSTKDVAVQVSQDKTTNSVVNSVPKSSQPPKEIVSTNQNNVNLESPRSSGYVAFGASNINYAYSPVFVQGITKQDLDSAVALLRGEMASYASYNYAQTERIFTRSEKNSKDRNSSSSGSAQSMTAGTISNSTITGGTITGATISGGSVDGTLTGTFEGDITASSFSTNGAIELTSMTPSGGTTDLLYNSGGDLYWNGNLLSSASSGTWTSSSGNAYRTTGFVGIGTSSPWRTLSVNGSSDLGTNALAGYFTATSTTASVLPYASTTALTVSGSSYIGTVLSGVWNGTAISDAYITKSGDWTGTFDGQEGTYYLNAINLNNFGTPFYSFFNATTTDALTQGGTNKYYSDSLVNTYINASTTIAKAYSSNTFTGANVWNGAGTFNSSLTVGSLTGPLQAVNGLVSASSTLSTAFGGTGLSSYTAGSLLYASAAGTLAGTTTANLKTTLALNNVENTALSTWAGSTNITTLGTISSGVWNGTVIGTTFGGTGLTSAPSYGQLLVGNASSGYTLTATSSLGIALSDTVGTLAVSKGGTGATSFGQGWIYTDGGTGAIAASTSPTVAYLTATSTTASRFPYASTTVTSATGICLANDCRSTWSDSTGTVFSSTTLAYFARIGTVPADAYRVDQFFRALDAAGLTSSLVDGALLRTTQNAASTSMKTIYGVDTTFVGTPTVGPDGLTTNGTSQYAYWAVTPTTEATVAEVYKGVISGQTSSGVLWSLQNQTGVGTGAGTSGWHLIFSGLSNAYVFSGNGSSVAVTSTIVDPVSSSASTINAYNPYEQINIVTNDNASSPTIKAYVDGKLTLNDSSGNVQTTSSLDRFVIGARWYTAGAGGVQSYSRGTHSAWLLFNRALTATESAALTSALRWLEPKKKNIVYVGDSTSAFLSTKPDDAWTYQHSIMKNQANARIYNQAINGQNAQYFVTNYDTLIYPFRPGVNGVEEADIYIWLGINDINGGATDSTTYTRLKALWARAKSDGFRVFVGTLMPGTSYTSTMEGYRQALNTSIASDQSLYDSLFRPDRLLLDPTDSAYYLDGFHLKAQGNHVIADMLNLDYSLASSTWSTYFGYASTSQLSVRNNLSIGSTSVNSSSFLLSVASSTSSYLNVLTSNGFVGVGTTSPWRTLSVNGSSDLGFNALAGYFTSTSTTASVFPYASTTAITSSSLFLGNSSFSSTYSAPLVIGVDGAGTGFQIGVSSSEYTKFVSGGSYKGMLGTGSLPLVIGAEGDVQFTNNFGPGFGERMMIKSTGNIGIGTTSPYSKLSVAGQVVAQNFVATSTTATSSAMIFSVGSSTPAAVNMFSVGTSSPILTVNSVNGFVGIGTTSPIDLLTIRPAVMSSGSEVLSLGRMGCSSGYMGIAVGSLGGNGCGNYGFISDGSNSLFNAPGASGAIYFRVQNLTKAQLTAAGKLGIGTSTPNNMLDIYSTSKSAIGFTGASGDAYKWTIGMDVTNAGRFAISSSTALGTSDRLVIDGAGEVGIGTTSPWRMLSVVGSVAINGLTSAASTADAICLNSTTKEVLVNTGAATCTVSSARFKHNIEDINVGLSELMKLRPVSFVYNETNEHRVGFIAEEVADIDQRFIFKEDDGRPRGVRYEDLVALLAKSMQEQQKQIENIQKDVASLRNDFNSIFNGDVGTSTLSKANRAGIINQLSASVIDAMKGMTNLVFDKITSAFAHIDHVDVDTLRVSNGIEIVDAETGRLYCITIRYGQFSTRPGKCSTNSPEFIPAQNNHNEQDQNNNQSPINNDDATTTATSTPEHVDVVTPDAPVNNPVIDAQATPDPSPVEPIEPIAPVPVIPEPKKDVTEPSESVQVIPNEPAPAALPPDVVQ